ncbi:hypothetical protein B0H11DRAFT_2247096 [Mycena galericulata]|nr:hypothetical protein B0H11DRAFT_2247096 [Mycena galericulata]
MASDDKTKQLCVYRPHPNLDQRHGLGIARHRPFTLYVPRIHHFHQFSIYQPTCPYFLRRAALRYIGLTDGEGVERVWTTPIRAKL